MSVIPKSNPHHSDVLTPLNVIHGINVCGGISASVSIPIPRRSSSPKWDTAHSWTKLIFSSLSFKFRLSMHYKNNSIFIICPENDITSLMLHEKPCLILWHTFNVASFFHCLLSPMTQLTISIFCSWDRLSSCSKQAMYMFAVHSWIACWHLKLHFPPFWFVWTDYWLNWIKSITKKKLKLENE